MFISDPPLNFNSISLADGQQIVNEAVARFQQLDTWK
jgi:hypothetical protein